MPAAFELLMSKIAMTQIKCSTMVIALVYGYFAAVTMHLTPIQFQFKVNEKQIKLHKNAAILNNIRNILPRNCETKVFYEKNSRLSIESEKRQGSIQW